MDRKRFFDHIRHPLFEGSMTQSQVDGINMTLDRCIHHGIEDEDAVANILATEYWETGRRMQPVRETHATSDAQAVARLENAWRKGQLPWVKTPYWRRDRNGQHPYGRGKVQLTHATNYEKADRALGLGGKLVKNYDLALDPLLSADIMVVGMREGWFTGRKLAHYFQPGDDPESDQVDARAIVNGTDRAKKIAEFAEDFERALEAAGGWSIRLPRPRPTPTPTPKEAPMLSWRPIVIFLVIVGLAAAAYFLL